MSLYPTVAAPVKPQLSSDRQTSRRSKTDRSDAEEGWDGQLVLTDIIHQSEPELFDQETLALLGPKYADQIAKYPPGERMMLALRLTSVKREARIVAGALAFHGWKSWPSQDRLAQLTDIRKNHVQSALSELDRAGIISKKRSRRKVNGQVRWRFDYIFQGRPLAEAFLGREGGAEPAGPGVSDAPPPQSREFQRPENPGPVADKQELPFSSEQEEKKEPEIQEEKNMVLEEEGKPLGKIENPETLQARMDYEVIPPPRLEAPGPPRPIYHPDLPPPIFMAGYCQSMLRKYDHSWLSRWEIPLEGVIRYYSTRWPKFLEDLQRHRGNELSNSKYGEGLHDGPGDEGPEPEAKIDPVRCIKGRTVDGEYVVCGEWTTKPRQLLRQGGEVATEGCDVCSPRPEAVPLKELARASRLEKEYQEGRMARRQWWRD